VFFANEDIKSGKELMFHNWELKAVSKEMFEKSAMKCKCGKPKCRKYIERMKLRKNAGHAAKRARTLCVCVCVPGLRLQMGYCNA
jgi:hypothetical protein